MLGAIQESLRLLSKEQANQVTTMATLLAVKNTLEDALEP